MKQNIFYFLIGGFLTLLLLLNFFSSQKYEPLFLKDVLAQATVTVSATVPQSTTCNLSATSTSFGNIDPNGVFTSAPNITLTISCNPAGGCTAQVKDTGNGTNGGLWNSTASYLIPSPAAGFPNTAILSDGTDGYGIQAATTTAGSGGVLSLNSIYNQTGNTVGKLATTTQVLASSTSPIANREVVVTHKAAVSGLAPAGSYSDNIIYSCTAN
jgi:hypothetical protein